MASSRYQRTQVYLEPDEHRRLRRLAAERGVSMTTVVREAVGQYLASGAREGGADDLVARLRAVADMPDAPDPEVSAVDRELGESVLEELSDQEAAWLERHKDAEAG